MNCDPKEFRDRVEWPGAVASGTGGRWKRCGLSKDHLNRNKGQLVGCFARRQVRRWP